MSHKTSAVRDVNMEHIQTAFTLNSTHVRNMFKVFNELEFSFLFVWESDCTCVLQGQKAESSQNFLFPCLLVKITKNYSLQSGVYLIKGSKVVSIRW